MTTRTTIGSAFRLVGPIVITFAAVELIGIRAQCKRSFEAVGGAHGCSSKPIEIQRSSAKLGELCMTEVFAAVYASFLWQAMGTKLKGMLGVLCTCQSSVIGLCGLF